MEKVDLKEIGARIAKLRKQKGLTQEYLAEKMDVSIQMISNLERGNKAIKIDNLIKLSKILGVSTDYILTGGSPVAEQQSPLNGFWSLTDKDRRMIEHLVLYCLNNN